MTKPSNKEQAIAIFNKHAQLAIGATDGGKLFRSTVIAEIMTSCNMSNGAACTYYNTAKILSPKIEGLGRKKKQQVEDVKTKDISGVNIDDMSQDDNDSDSDCYTVIELLKHNNSENRTVGRTVSFTFRGEASEFFDEKIQYEPTSKWVMIKGIGPMHTELYKLEANEELLKAYTPEYEEIFKKEALFND